MLNLWNLICFDSGKHFPSVKQIISSILSGKIVAAYVKQAEDMGKMLY